MIFEKDYEQRDEEKDGRKVSSGQPLRQKPKKKLASR
jgi:hypothetical protein